MKAFDAQTCPIPASSGVFLRVWKHQCTSLESKIELLRQCGPTKLQSIFKINLPGELLSDILVVLHSVTTAGSIPAEKASQGCADSQQVFAQADEMCSRDAELISDIMKALSGEHAVYGTSVWDLLHTSNFASMDSRWTENDWTSFIRDRKICPDSEADQP